ncbi:MAG TPA: hypothetical protein VE954_09165 [Oligoflexus sp.]|uniref:hypothetical protein n=1 Tax=Oligoflexus sp. TaxID=1971216 RepID=UPI002D48E9F3|nr:hypothetical protein [Oligoflexus sp.]HYX33270.1 hypothetical protein [Oligoflexus sp.]
MKRLHSIALGLSFLCVAGSATARPPIEKLCPVYHQAVGTCTYGEFTVSSRSACFARVELKDILLANDVEFSEEDIICEEHRVPD